MWVNEERVDLEVQVRNLGDYEARSVDYWSMSYWASIEVGGKYSDLARTVCLNIVDFKLFPGTKVHSEFQILEVTDHFPLTDKLDIHFFELPKLTEEVDLNDDMSLWLALLGANSEEE
jgi:predicted transposase/invertase (TIGR01784 family)